MCVSFLQLLQVMVITTVCFECTAGPSIISNDRIWAIVKKTLPTTAYRYIVKDNSISAFRLLVDEFMLRLIQKIYNKP